MSEVNSAELQLKVARTLIRKRDFDGATAHLQNLLNENPSDGDALELMGMACFLNKQPEKARDAYEQLTKEDPLRSSGWINLGAVLNQLGEHKKAADVLRRGLQRDRNNAEGFFNLGIAQKALRLTTMAITAYKEAIRCKPEMIDAHLHLGALYAEMKNHGLAQQSFQAALRINPDSKRAKSLLAQSLDFQRQARKSTSPFGRLVDEQDLASRQSTHTAPRTLSPARRDEERELIQAITKRIKPVAKEIPDLLDVTLLSHLHQLQIVALQGDPRFANPDIHEQFVETIATLKEIRSSIADNIAELRAHLDLLAKSPG